MFIFRHLCVRKVCVFKRKTQEFGLTPGPCSSVSLCLLQGVMFISSARGFSFVVRSHGISATCLPATRQWREPSRLLLSPLPHLSTPRFSLTVPPVIFLLFFTFFFHGHPMSLPSVLVHWLVLSVCELPLFLLPSLLLILPSEECSSIQKLAVML